VSARTRLADSDAADSRRLIAAMEAEINEIYEDHPESIHEVGTAGDLMREPGGSFILVEVDGEAVGCGGLRRLDTESCEIKRMYIVPEHRGRGLSRTLLAALEERAKELGYVNVKLDTGDRLPKPKALYESSGYSQIPDYNGNTQAAYWFEKPL
jgi:GNAT superfamily N-acetyltransferase